MSSGERNIAESVRIILFTRPGERLMRPDFGCRIHELVFAPNNTTTASLAEEFVRRALQRWEPRIEDVQVRVNPVPAEALLSIAVDYRIIDTNNRRNAVYPFYLEAGDE